MEPKRVYFLGIGGIGMSAIARYFMHEGLSVAGYDRVRTPLTQELEAEGAQIHYEDSVELIPKPFTNREETLVVYTPAVPTTHSEFVYLQEAGFECMKRSQILGVLTANKYVMAVAGTHGKTSTSTLVAWLNHRAQGEGSAFLGGLSKNFNSNLVLGAGDRMTVEADEFDRSFLRLYPDVAVITSADADHLDIYGTHEAVKEAFAQFAAQIKTGGALILKKGVALPFGELEAKVWRYSYDEPTDFYASNIELLEGGHYRFDIETPSQPLKGCTLGVPGWVNIENCVAAVASLWCAAQSEGKELDSDKIREALATFEGVKRRLEFYVNTPKRVYMDDYAHHPRELAATLNSVREMLPGRHITAIFQPHLYTRTRDLHEGFAEALSLADRVILLPIYPARELPIEGVSSELIASGLSVPCEIKQRGELCDYLEHSDCDIVITFGAGDIDVVCRDIADTLRAK